MSGYTAPFFVTVANLYGMPFYPSLLLLEPGSGAGIDKKTTMIAV